MGKRTTKRKEIATYVDPDEIKKIHKRRGQRGLITISGYLRVLINEDLVR